MRLRSDVVSPGQPGPRLLKRHAASSPLPLPAHPVPSDRRPSPRAARFTDRSWAKNASTHAGRLAPSPPSGSSVSSCRSSRLSSCSTPIRRTSPPIGSKIPRPGVAPWSSQPPREQYQPGASPGHGARLRRGVPPISACHAPEGSPRHQQLTIARLLRRAQLPPRSEHRYAVARPVVQEARRAPPHTRCTLDPPAGRLHCSWSAAARSP